MALFQKSVVRKFLNDLDKTKLQEAWQLFKNHFHNQDVQKHIWDSKEEEYQEGFVRDLFVNVLDYILKPQPHYNFVLEKKTEADATKSDGAMLREETVIGVIELKDTDTTELDSIEKQVFGYKHKHKNCVYVITSNFEKLRFYINDSIEFEEFDLFNLTEEGFTLLYLCLQQKNIENDLPLKIKQASVAEEEGVTKKLYAEYSAFKRQLFTNMAALNPQYNKLDLFQKTQKLLDRFLFILFAEDRLLVPPNSVREILKQWEQLKELDSYEPLYLRFKKYFGYLNKGHAGKQYDIYAYNGGLFADDEILDNIKIDDKLLHEGTKALSNYDFQSEVDVNILGHIFEHSLGEIEEVQAELEGKAVEKTKTKRKKDGVFYTPRYITKYIVENTVGELCRQKKEELKITDDEFAYRKRSDARENKLKKLNNYRKWLLELTICDPACGSGAFLNQALEFLIAEHRYIDELRARLLGEKMVMNDMETEILSHNLFGVDINEEAVEIARLSLWLRTAQKGRKLSDLSKNIKCGNSLIDDPAAAGDKAFNWKKEFPQIFGEYKEKLSAKPPVEKPKSELITPETILPEEKEEIEGTQNYTYQKITNQDFRITNDDNQIVNEPAVQYISASNSKGGFDVVIGNPPYLRVQGLRESFEKESLFYESQYKTATGRFDIYVLFIEKGYSIINAKGVISFILPHKFMVSDFGEGVRNFIVSEKAVKSIVSFGAEMVFEEASAYTCIVTLSKNNSHILYKEVNPIEISLPFLFDRIEYSSINNEKWNMQNKQGASLFEKLNKQPLKAKDIFDSISQGIVSVGDDIFIMQGSKQNDRFIGYSEKIGKNVEIEYELMRPLLKGDEVKKYSPLTVNYYVVYPHYERNGKTIPYEEEDFKSKFPLAYAYFLQFKDELIEKKIRYKTNPKYWYSLHRSREVSLFEQEKLVTPETSFGCNMSIDTSLLYHNTQIYSFVKKEGIDVEYKFLLAILNSTLLWYYLKNTGNILRGGFFRFKTAFLEPFPMPDYSKINRVQFIDKADIMLFKNKELYEAKKQFLQLLTSKYEGLNISKKSENWPTLSFKDFLKELTKQKIRLSLAEQTEWMQHFENEKAKANAIQQVIDTTDKEIDRMVYNLYGLTEEEIKIVEGE